MPPDHDTHALHRLVERTDGPQPWRKLFHAFTGVTIAAALTWSPLSRWTAVTILATVLAVLLLVDVLRLRSARANRLFFRFFSSLASPREARGLASSTWYALGVLIVVAAFHRQDAVSAVLVLAVADSAASYLGRRWGRAPFLGGTVLGTTVFYLLSAGILSSRHGFAIGCSTALAVTLAERRAWPLDDNLAVPVACGSVLAAFRWLA